MPPKRFPKRQPAGKKPPVARLTLEDIQNSGASTSAAAAAANSSDDTQSNYEDELAWCIHKLKTSLLNNKLAPKQVEDATKNLKTLENPKESMVKKRCLMKMNFGNYRQQMEVERRNVSLGLQNAKISAQETAKQGQFMRKSHSADPSCSKFSFQSSDNSFRFNFSPESSE